MAVSRLFKLRLARSVSHSGIVGPVFKEYIFSIALKIIECFLIMLQKIS